VGAWKKLVLALQSSGKSGYMDRRVGDIASGWGIDWKIE